MIIKENIPVQSVQKSNVGKSEIQNTGIGISNINHAMSNVDSTTSASLKTKLLNQSAQVSNIMKPVQCMKITQVAKQLVGNSVQNSEHCLALKDVHIDHQTNNCNTNTVGYKVVTVPLPKCQPQPTLVTQSVSGPKQKQMTSSPIVW